MKKVNSKPAAFNPLAGRTEAAAFVQSYWQQQPAVIRSALSRSELKQQMRTAQVLRLARQDMVESRLIRRTGQSWDVTDGPFDSGEIPTLATPDWTVLIQGVDLHTEAGRHLLERFRFIPDARIDDLMISVAGDHGGVGPHVDNYDVFLLQLAGAREWQIGPPDSKHRLQDDQPLKLLASFTPEATMTLSAGDMLYLPAGWAHNGIANGSCMTASIGFRAPARAELQSAWLLDAADQAAIELADDPRYRDPLANAAITRRWISDPARIPNPMMTDLSNWLREWRPTAKSLHDFIGRYLTEPRSEVWFERPSQSKRPTASWRRHGIILDRKTRMLWHEQRIFINGESLAAVGETKRLLRELANHRYLDGADTGRLIDQPVSAALLVAWHGAGWIRMNNS